MLIVSELHAYLPIYLFIYERVSGAIASIFEPCNLIIRQCHAMGIFTGTLGNYLSFSPQAKTQLGEHF